MATPVTTKWVRPGALGDILIDVRHAPSAGPAPAVVILHGFKGFKDWGMFPPLADRLARAGLAAVSWNTSGSGVDDEGRFSFPERFAHATFSADLADLDIVLAAVRDGSLGLTPTSVGLVGHSRGGGIAILHAAGDSGIHALVTWGAISSTMRWSAEMRQHWRTLGSLAVTNTRTGEVLQLSTDLLDDAERNAEALDIERKAAMITAPWCIVHGAVDETVPAAEAHLLASANPRADLRLIENTGHTFGAVHPFAGPTPALETVFDTTIGFLSRHLP